MEYKDYYNRIYEKRGAYFHRWGKYNKSYYDHMHRIISFVKGGKKTLDLGCGDCFITNEINKKTPVIGVDVSSKAVSFGKKLHKNLKLILAEVFALPFDSKSFDNVVLSKVIEHLEPSDAELMLSEIKRVLKKNGKLILSTPYPVNIWSKIIPLMLIGRHKDHEHVKEYTGAELRRLLSKYFKIESMFFAADPPFFAHFPRMSVLLWRAQKKFLKTFPFVSKYFYTGTYAVARN